MPLFAKAGIQPEAAFFDESSRQLAFATNQADVQMIRVRSFDVATYVAYGGADIGICGSDVLEEFDFEAIYAPVNLNIGHCRMCLAAPEMLDVDAFMQQESHVRVATKYPHTTRHYFAGLGIQAECIKLSGAMELAPKMGLANFIVDLVSTGNTLKANGLRELATLSAVSSRLIVSRSAYKTKSRRVQPLLGIFEQAVHG